MNLTVLDRETPYPRLPDDWNPHSLWDQLSPTLDPHIREAVDRFHRARTEDTQLLQTVPLAQVLPSTHPEAPTAVIQRPLLDRQDQQTLVDLPVIRPSHRRPKVKKVKKHRIRKMVKKLTFSRKRTRAVVIVLREPHPEKVSRLKVMKARLSLYLYEHWGIK